MKKSNDKQYFSILQWITERGIVSEKGEPFDYHNRPFLLDILTDFTPNIALMACAQVGKSVTFSLKTLFAVKHLHLNVIYTMPTDTFVSEFVASKFDKIVQMNSEEFKDMQGNNVQRKELNDRFIFFDGTESKTAGISTTADVLVHDEISRSNQPKIVQYRSRTKASQYKGRWIFSNPGTERDELDQEHQKSDQKEWNITCPHCNDTHELSFPDSIDMENYRYICRACKQPISDEVRRRGKWIDKDGVEWTGTLNPRYKVSGWRISHLMCPDISVREIIEESNGDPAYFNNFVLGRAYSPGDLSVSKTTILDLWTPKDLTTQNIYLGVDVGNIKHYVVRSDKGLLKLGRFTKASELDDIIRTWNPTSGVIDAMPDTVLSRYVVETYPFMQMSYFQENSVNPQTIVWWGEGEKKGIVYSFRDRILDQFLTQMIEAKWLIGVPSDEMFRLYIKHFETLRREKVVNNKGIERYIWASTTGEDHFCFDKNTLITTKNGDFKIKDVKVGDLVLTRTGYKKVLHNGITQKTNVVEAEFSDGTKLIATPDHPFYVKNKGMKPLRDLLYGDILVTCKKQLREKRKSSSTKALSLEDTQTQAEELNKYILSQVEILSQKVLAVCTKKYGKKATAQFQKDIVSIIKIMTRLITKYLTWNVSRKECTSHTTSKRVGLIQSSNKIKLKELEKKLQRELRGLENGLKLAKEKSISKNIKATLLHELSLFASNVGKKLYRPVGLVGNSVLKDVQHVGTQESGVKNTQNITLVTIRPLKGERNVYNLFVEDVHEYYANGILVSNCFADLYSYIAMLGAGSGTFYGEISQADKPSVLGADNVYDLSKMFSENQTPSV